jgi:large subunit ribosomal protein L31
MKKGIHPVYNEVIFKDVSTGFSFLGRSTTQSKEVETWSNGKQYPLIKLDVSSASHPFYTGTQRMMDAEGRVERFRKRYSK